HWRPVATSPGALPERSLALLPLHPIEIRPKRRLFPLKQNHPTGHSQIRPAIVVAGKRGALIVLGLYACDSFPRHNQIRRREKIGISLAIFNALRNWVIDYGK
ncbi:MAG TPA: hypothetical protein VJZ77_23420, partial [Blastocatellia bacterium]|nr:hypothetical protein [Blastocatellia bacterium]